MDIPSYVSFFRQVLFQREAIPPTMPPTIAPTEPETCDSVIEEGFGLPAKGYNLNNGAIDLSETAQSCCDRCRRNTDCFSWTWIKPLRHCYLKWAGPEYTGREHSKDAISGIKTVGCKVVFYKDTHFKVPFSAMQPFGPGNYSAKALGLIGMSSLMLHGQCAVTLYSKENFGGEKALLTDSVCCLDKVRHNRPSASCHSEIRTRIRGTAGIQLESLACGVTAVFPLPIRSDRLWA